MIDGIARPGLVFYRRQLRSLRRDVGPMSLPLRTLIDPLTQQFDLRLGQRLPEFGRRHVVLFVNGRDAAEKITLLGGVYQGAYMSQSEITTLASIPSMNGLRGQFVGLLSNSIAGVVRILDAKATQMESVPA